MRNVVVRSFIGVVAGLVGTTLLIYGGLLVMVMFFPLFYFDSGEVGPITWLYLKIPGHTALLIAAITAFYFLIAYGTARALRRSEDNSSRYREIAGILIFSVLVAVGVYAVKQKNLADEQRIRAANEWLEVHDKDAEALMTEMTLRGARSSPQALQKLLQSSDSFKEIAARVPALSSQPFERWLREIEEYAGAKEYIIKKALKHCVLFDPYSLSFSTQFNRETGLPQDKWQYQDWLLIKNGFPPGEFYLHGFLEHRYSYCPRNVMNEGLPANCEHVQDGVVCK